MTDSTTTRIKLPTDIHRQVKAAAVLHGIRTDEALGMCVAYLVAQVNPLSWLDSTRSAQEHNPEKGD